MSTQNSDNESNKLYALSPAGKSATNSESESDNKAETPTYEDTKDEITNFVQSGSFYRFELTGDEEDQLKKIQEDQEDQEKEEEEEYKVFTKEQIDRKPDVVDDAIAEVMASQVVDETNIKIVEDPVTKTAVITTSKRARKESEKQKLVNEVKVLKQAAKEAKEAEKNKKENPIQHIFPIQNSQLGDTQDAYEYIKVEVGSQSTVARQLITNDIRLESITPDSQAKKIFTQDELDAMTSCYLCGCEFEDRISAKHNERWGYPKDQITKSYDHSAPINFSAVVARVPSSDSSYEPFEKDFLKLNGKMACFHCNYTKSQRMFITCPKDADGNIDFQKFAPNDGAIRKFIDNLWDSKSEWSIGPSGENTLHQCVGKTPNDIKKWKDNRIKAITDSVKKICNMIKEHVSQDNVIKRFYFTNLLIAKARELLKKDQYFNDPTISDKTKKGYEKRYIVKFVNKSEATNPEFVTPWTKALKRSKRRLPDVEEVEKETDTETSQDKSEEYEETVSPNPSKTQKLSGSSRKRKQTRKRKNKRKTYRRIRLF